MRQRRAQALELGDALVDARRPARPKAVPSRRATGTWFGGKPRELGGDFFE